MINRVIILLIIIIIIGRYPISSLLSISNVVLLHKYYIIHYLLQTAHKPRCDYSYEYEYSTVHTCTLLVVLLVRVPVRQYLPLLIYAPLR